MWPVLITGVSVASANHRCQCGQCQSQVSVWPVPITGVNVASANHWTQKKNVCVAEKSTLW